MALSIKGFKISTLVAATWQFEVLRKEGRARGQCDPCCLLFSGSLPPTSTPETQPESGERGMVPSLPNFDSCYS